MNLLIIISCVIVTIVLIKIFIKTREKNRPKNNSDIIFADESTWRDYTAYLKAKKACKEGKDEKAMLYFNEIKNEFFLEYKTECRGEFYQLRGICNQRFEEHSNAIKDLGDAIKYSPSDCHNYFLISISFSAMDDNENAKYSLEKALELLKLDSYVNRKYNEYAKREQNIDLFNLYEISLYRERKILESKQLHPRSM